MSEEINDQIEVRLNKMNDLREKGLDPFGQKFETDATSKELYAKWDEFSKEELKEKESESKVRIAGRIMTKRGKGKAGFALFKISMGKFKYTYVKTKLVKMRLTYGNKQTSVIS